MVDQASETLFFQDNLLSEDDWGGALNLVDLKDLTSSVPSSPSDDFYLGDEAKYQEEYALHTKATKCLTMPNQDTSLSATITASKDCDFVDELLQDLLQAKPCENKNISDELLLRQSTSAQLERRYSTNTASSSAYSSCSNSGTPSPTEQFSDHASCSSGEFQDQETLTIDLTSPTNTETCLANSGNWDDGICAHEESSSYLESNFKSDRFKKTASISQDLLQASDLEKAVRLACQETNRLLRLHKRLSNTAISTDHQSNEQDMLKSLCEETILKNQPSSNNGTAMSPPKRPQKRKASTLQDAIDRLQSANKSLCVGQTKSSHSTPFSRSALVNNTSEMKFTTKGKHTDSTSPKPKGPRIVGSKRQQLAARKITLDSQNVTKTYTLTPTVPPSIQFYVKQEPPTFQPCSVVGNFYQPHVTQKVEPVSNHKFFVSMPSTSGLTLAAPSNGISIVKPEQIVCNNGQTVVIQQPAQSVSQPMLKPVNISSIKPGLEPVVLSQSDLSRLAAQGVIKFPSKKIERNLMPVSDENKMQIRSELKPAAKLGRNHAIFPAVCDTLPSEAAGIINGTSVLVNGIDNHPRHGELDVKALKRQQRMIKNRASACESRQRRKEYLKMLEDQVTEVAQENKKLQEKNEYLLSRVHELEIENKNLRDMMGVSQSNRKKTACVLMLVLLAGINLFPIRLFGPESGPQGNLGLASPSQSANTVHPGRHLLSLNGDQNNGRTEETNFMKDENSLVLSEKQSYWMDDLVRQYKDKHLENFLQILSETTSNSVKRMLRRKLKEELGIKVPLPLPRSRRIAYTPLGNRQRMDRTVSFQSSKPTDVKETVSPKITPTVHPAGAEVKLPVALPNPCEHPNSEETGLNETETSRVNEDLTKWAKRFIVDRQEKAQKSAEKNKVTKKKIRNTKAPSSRYEDNDNSTSTSEVALYARPNKKFDDFLDAINRRNDTFYIVSLNRDHLLLPATVQNTSSRMKMALVMPAVTSKEHSPHDHVSDEYETMMHIECEVLNTWMFDLKRKDIPDFSYINPGKVALKSLDSISNETLSQGQGSSKHQLLPSSERKGKNHVRNVKSKMNGAKEEETQKFEDELVYEDDAVVSDVADPDIHKDPIT